MSTQKRRENNDAVAYMVDVVRPVVRRVCAQENVLVDGRGVGWFFRQTGPVGCHKHSARIGTHGPLLRQDAGLLSQQRA